MAPSSSSGGSHAGLAIAATAMALSGTLVLYSLCRAKQPHLVPSDSDAPSPRLRPCLSSSGKCARAVRSFSIPSFLLCRGAASYARVPNRPCAVRVRCRTAGALLV